MCISWNNKKYFESIDARCKHEDNQQIHFSVCHVLYSQCFHQHVAATITANHIYTFVFL